MQIKMNEQEARELAYTIRQHLQERLSVSVPLRDILVFLKHDNLLTIERETGTFLYRPERGAVAVVSVIPAVNNQWTYKEVENPRLQD